jgi:hypothetical protein
MFDVEGNFELELVDDRAPGVFMPVTSTVRGRLSPAAIRYFERIEPNHPVERLEALFRAAVENRWRIERRRSIDLVVKATDFQT